MTYTETELEAIVNDIAHRLKNDEECPAAIRYPFDGAAFDQIESYLNARMQGYQKAYRWIKDHFDTAQGTEEHEPRQKRLQMLLLRTIDMLESQWLLLTEVIQPQVLDSIDTDAAWIDESLTEADELFWALVKNLGTVYKALTQEKA